MKRSPVQVLVSMLKGQSLIRCEVGVPKEPVEGGGAIVIL